MAGSTVTLLVADLAGRVDDAARRSALADVRAVAEAHGGREVRAAGDGLTVAFTGAAAAVRCAAQMQGYPGSRVRIGLAACEPLTDGDER